MLALQLFTSDGWRTVGEPYAPADVLRVQQAATMLAHSTGAVWRVLGESGRVLSLWDGRRWHVTAESAPMPAQIPKPWWEQQSQPWQGYHDTIPLG